MSISKTLLVLLLSATPIIFTFILVYFWVQKFKEYRRRSDRIKKNKKDDVIGCPNCGSRAVHYLELDQEWACTKCGHHWKDKRKGFFSF